MILSIKTILSSFKYTAYMRCRSFSEVRPCTSLNTSLTGVKWIIFAVLLVFPLPLHCVKWYLFGSDTPYRMI